MIYLTDWCIGRTEDSNNSFLLESYCIFDSHKNTHILLTCIFWTRYLAASSRVYIQEYGILPFFTTFFFCTLNSCECAHTHVHTHTHTLYMHFDNVAGEDWNCSKVENPPEHLKWSLLRPDQHPTHQHLIVTAQPNINSICKRRPKQKILLTCMSLLRYRNTCREEMIPTLAKWPLSKFFQYIFHHYLISDTQWPLQKQNENCHNWYIRGGRISLFCIQTLMIYSLFTSHQ